MRLTNHRFTPYDEIKHISAIELLKRNYHLNTLRTINVLETHCDMNSTSKPTFTIERNIIYYDVYYVHQTPIYVFILS